MPIAVLALALWAASPALPAQAGFDVAPLERVLSSYVDEDGFVNYAALKKDRGDLDRFIAELARLSPAGHPELFPTRDAQLAYWINAYNAEVLRIVVDHYPTESITKIGLIPFSAFFTLRVELGGKKMTLRALENQVIRGGFHEPRIHFAINCASRSCPRLSRKVYRPETLEAQLDDAARAFINDSRQVTLDGAGGKIALSKIFEWYESDFTDAAAKKLGRKASVADFLRPYLTPERQAILGRLAGAKVTHHDYDWGLNERKSKP